MYQYLDRCPILFGDFPAKLDDWEALQSLPSWCWPVTFCDPGPRTVTHG